MSQDLFFFWPEASGKNAPASSRDVVMSLRGMAASVKDGRQADTLSIIGLPLSEGNNGHYLGLTQREERLSGQGDAQDASGGHPGDRWRLGLALLEARQSNGSAHPRILTQAAPGDPSLVFGIAFDGQLTNPQVLHDELARVDAPHPIGTPEAALVLSLYQHLGERVSVLLEGAWAFILYDPVQELVFASRDRIGHRPLVYSYQEGIVAVASQYRPLLALHGGTGRISRAASFAYLAQGIVSGPDNPFIKHLHELPPGSNLVYKAQSQAIKTWRYYKLDATTKYDRFSGRALRHYTDKVALMASQAILDHLRASAGIAGILYREPNLESALLATIVDHLIATDGAGGPSTVTRILADTGEPAPPTPGTIDPPAEVLDLSPEDLLEDLEDWICSQEMPPASLADYRYYALARRAGQVQTGAQVWVGTGLGFVLGQQAHYATHISELTQRGRYGEALKNVTGERTWMSRRRPMLSASASRIAREWFPRKFLEGRYQASDPALTLFRRSFWSKYAKLLGPEVGALPDGLQAHLLADTTGPMMAACLRTLDRSARRWDVSLAAPLLDARLIEYLFTIPPVYKIHRGRGMYALRQAFRGLLPSDELARLEKMPPYNWQPEALTALRGPLRDYITEDIDEVVNYRHLLADWDRHYAYALPRPGAALWRIITFALWRRLVMKRGQLDDQQDVMPLTRRHKGRRVS